MTAISFVRNGAIIKKLCFRIMKENKRNDEVVTKKIEIVLEGLRYQALARSFKRIKSCFEIQKKSIDVGKKTGVKNIADMLTYLVDRKKR
jgi:hypothetical protein